MILAFALPSCAPSEEKTLYSASFLQFFDTVTLIKGYETSKEEFASVSQEIYDLVEKYHRLFDIYYEYSSINNLCTVNKRAGEEVVVPVELIDFLELAIDMHNECSGEVNIAMGSVLSIWHAYRENGINDPENARLPSIEELNAASEHVDISKIKLDRERSSVTLLDPEMKLDVGAIAKGYTAELVAKHLEEMGKTGYVISLGGNIRTVGEKPNGESWRLGIENPFYNDGEGEEYLLKLALSGGYSLVTSGNYQRYYTVNGKRYHHIIDPETLFPKDDYVLVSIIARDSGVADALSTALFNMSVEEGKALISGFSDVEAIWYLSDGDIVCSDGIDELLMD